MANSTDNSNVVVTADAPESGGRHDSFIVFQGGELDFRLTYDVAFAGILGQYDEHGFTGVRQANNRHLFVEADSNAPLSEEQTATAYRIMIENRDATENAMAQLYEVRLERNRVQGLNMGLTKADIEAVRDSIKLPESTEAPTERDVLNAMAMRAFAQGLESYQETKSGLVRSNSIENFLRSPEFVRDLESANRIIANAADNGIGLPELPTADGDTPNQDTPAPVLADIWERGCEGIEPGSPAHPAEIAKGILENPDTYDAACQNMTAEQIAIINIGIYLYAPTEQGGLGCPADGNPAEILGDNTTNDIDVFIQNNQTTINIYPVIVLDDGSVTIQTPGQQTGQTTPDTPDATEAPDTVTPNATPAAPVRPPLVGNDATRDIQRTLLLLKEGGAEGIDIGAYGPKGDGVDGIKGTMTNGSLTSIGINILAPEATQDALTREFVTNPELREQLLAGLKDAAANGDPNGYAASFLAERNMGGADLNAQIETYELWLESQDGYVAAVTADVDDTTPVIDNDPVVPTPEPEPEPEPEPAPDTGADKPLDTDFRQATGGRAWQGVTFEDELTLGRGDEVTINGVTLQGPRDGEIEYKIGDQTDGVKDKGLNRVDRDWAESLGADRDGDNLPEANKVAAENGVLSLGRNGEVFVTRIDEIHGLMRRDVTELIANGDYDELALANVPFQDNAELMPHLTNIYDAMTNKANFDARAGVVLNLDDGIQVRVHEVDGAMNVSLVSKYDDPSVISRAIQQTPPGVLRDQEWGDFNKHDEAARKLSSFRVPEATTATVPEATADVEETPAGPLAEAGKDITGTGEQTPPLANADPEAAADEAVRRAQEIQNTLPTTPV